MCATPVSTMLSPQSMRDDVCGVTIESCHDQMDATGTPSAPSALPLRSASQAFVGRICASDAPAISQACMLPWCGVPMVISRRTLAPPYCRR